MTTEIKYDTLDQESSILARFQEIKNPNAKKVKKLAARLFREAPYEVQRRVCYDIYRANDPLTYMNSCIEKIHDCAILTKQFIEEGYHGMIFTGKDGTEVFPIQLDTRTNWLEENKRWDLEQEMIIAHEACGKWMEVHDKGYFYGKAVLFPLFGFSGEPRLIEMSCGDTKDMVKYPGTNFWVRKGTNLDLSEEARKLQEKLNARRTEKTGIIEDELKREFQRLGSAN